MQDKKVEAEIVEQLEITSDLQHEFSCQSAYFANWAFLHARAQDKVRELEEKVEVSFFELYDEYRGEHSSAKENECKSFIRTHPDHQKLTEELRKAQFNADILKAGVRAFEMRKDMLVQLGAQNRAEQEGTDLKTATQKATRVIKNNLKGKRHGKNQD